MFKELLPVLRDRAVMISVMDLKNDQLRVSIIPKVLKESDNKALTEPFSVEGTAEELDAQLPTAIVNYTASHLELKNTLAQAQATMAAAAAEAKKEAAEKAKNRATNKPGSTGSVHAKTDAEPVTPTPAPATQEPALPGLFDSAEPASSTTSSEAATAANVGTAAPAAPATVANDPGDEEEAVLEDAAA